MWFIINSSFSVSNLTAIRPWPQSNLETSALTLWSRWFSSFSLRTTWWTVWCWWYEEESRQRPCSHTVACCLGKTPPPVHKNTQIKAQWMNIQRIFPTWAYSMCILKDILVRDVRDIKFDLGVSTGVDLCPAVGRHVAQDLRHLLEHSQTPHVDLRAESNNKIRKRLIELLAGATWKDRNVCLCYLCVELLSQVSEQVFISIRSFTVEPHNMIWTLTDPVSNELQDTIQTDLLHTHREKNIQTIWFKYSCSSIQSCLHPRNLPE